MCPPWVLISSEGRFCLRAAGQSDKYLLQQVLLILPTPPSEDKAPKPLACPPSQPSDTSEPQKQVLPFLAAKLELRAQALWRANRAHIYSIWGAQSRAIEVNQRQGEKKGGKKRGWSFLSRRLAEGKVGSRTGTKMGDLIGCNLVRIMHEWDEKTENGIYYYNCSGADWEQKAST